MTEQQLEQQIRFADQLADSYFSTLERLRASGRRGIGGTMVYREDSLQNAIGQAAGLADSLIDAARQASVTAAAVGLEDIPTPEREPYDPPVLESEEHTQLRLHEVQSAVAEIRGLQGALPHIDWTTPEDELDVDLFASKKKTALIVGGVVAASAVGLAFFYPMPAFVIGMLAVVLLGRPILRELIWRQS